MSRREADKITPCVDEAQQALALTRVPPVVMTDTPLPDAHAHIGAVVLSTGLVSLLTEEELTAVMVHELHHWAQGDVLALRFVWACAWPIAMMANFLRWLERQSRLISLLARVALWPAVVLVRWFIVPLAAMQTREQEYGADAAAAAAGHGAGLIAALEKLKVFENARSGWEQALASSHPPTELRIDALLNSDEDPMAEARQARAARWRVVRSALGAAALLGVVILSGQAVVYALHRWAGGRPAHAATSSSSTTRASPILPAFGPPTPSVATSAPPPARFFPTTADVNLRTGASSTAQSLTIIPTGTQIQVQCKMTGENVPDPNGGTDDAFWDRVTYQHMTGYVADQFVNTNDRTADDSVIAPC